MDIEFLELVEKASKLDNESFEPESLLTATTNKIKEYLLCEQTYGEDRPLEEADFEEHRPKSLIGLKCLLMFLKKLENLTQDKPNKGFVMWALLLCGEHTSNNQWTTMESVKISSECLNILMSMHKCKSISDLLLHGNNSPQYISSVLLALRPKLLKETWRKYPAAVHSYQWILLQIKSPYLSDYLNAVFPTALIILDDYVTSRRLVGLTCITHIIQNVPRTNLCSQGLDNVLYHTLKPLLLQREPELITAVYACMTTLLGSVEQGYTKSVAQGQWGRLESTLYTLLCNMECEDRLVLRIAYVKSLEPILKAMGPSVIQLSKKLLSIFEEYLDKQTPDARHYAILAFETYIYNSKERLPSNGEKVLYLLLRTLYDLTKEMDLCENCSKPTFTEVLENRILYNNSAEKCSTHQLGDLFVIINSVKFLKTCTPNQFELIRADIKENVNFNSLLTDIVKHLF